MSYFSIENEKSINVRITEDDVEKFAEVTGDTNSLHINENEAKNGPFGERVAHGVYILGLVSNLLAEFGENIIIDEFEEIDFINPVYIEDEVLVKCEVIEETGRKASIRFDVENISQEKVSVSGKVNIFEGKGKKLV